MAKSDHKEPKEHKADHHADAPKPEATVAAVDGPAAPSTPYTSTGVRDVSDTTPRPTVISPTSDKLAEVTALHVAVFSPDELSILSSAVTELRAYEDLAGSPAHAPALRAVPFMAQDAIVMTCTTGSWEGEPDEYDYAWCRDDVFVSGGPASSYNLTTDDVGRKFTCVVTASNAAGATTATSNAVVAHP